ncbi:MAG: hypothetical protein PHG82_00280 [Candidatus Gracilibacteria bacterium]|nr:hypothetical protein [Candidatus Gracilibacteria bacterium]
MVVQTNSHNLATFTTVEIMRHKLIAKESLELEIIDILSKENHIQEVYKRKANFILGVYPEIYKNIKISDSDKIRKIIPKDIEIVNNEEINKENLNIWLRKKMIERCIEGRTFYAKEELKKLRDKRGYEMISVDDFVSKIISGEIVLEKYIKYRPLENYEKIEDKKLFKNINSIKSNLNAIIKIINNDIKKHHYFLVEHLSDITPLIAKIQRSLQILNRESDKIDDHFKDLKDELVKGLNIDEGFIKSCLFQINQVINTL